MGVIDKLTGALEDAASGVGKAASALSGGAEHAAADAFKGAVDGVKSAASGVEHAAGDVAKGAIHAGHDVVEGARHGDLAGGLRRAGGDLAKGAGLAVSDHFHGMADAVGHVAHGASAAVRDAGVAAGKAYDGAVDGGSRAVGDVAGARAGALVHGLAEGLAEPVRQTANFDYGVVTGAGDGLGTLVRSTGDLVVGGVRMGTDAEFRDHLIAKAEHVASAVAKDPGGAAKAVGHAAEGAWKHFVAGGEAAARNGTLSEYVGHATGEVGFTIATTIGAPETKVGQVANLAGDVGRAAETLGDAGRVANVLGDSGKTAKVAGEADRAASAMGADSSAVKIMGGAAKPAKAALTEAAIGLGPSGWLGEVNQVNGDAHSLVNCVQCALTVDRRLATGDLCCATSHNPHVFLKMSKLDQMEKVFGAPFERAGRVRIEKNMLQSGEGARAVIVGRQGPDAHVWNAVVQDGRVRYLDGQEGVEAAHNFKDFPQTAVAITGKTGDGVVHELSVADRNARAEAWAANEAAAPAHAAPAEAVEIVGPVRKSHLAAAQAMTRASGTATALDVRLVADGIAQRLPKPVIDALNARGVPVYVVRDTIGEHYPHLKAVQDPANPAATADMLTAAYFPESKEMIIATQPGDAAVAGAPRELPRGNSVDAITHEFGHAVDENLYGGSRQSPLSQSPAFTAAFNAYKQSGFASERFMNLPPHEVFAETYASYLQVPDIVQSNAPEMFAYFDRLVKQPI